MSVHGGKEVTGYCNPEETLPSMKVMCKSIEVKFTKETLEEIINKQLNIKQLLRHLIDGLREAEAEHNTSERGVEPKDIDRRISKTSSA